MALFDLLRRLLAPSPESAPPKEAGAAREEPAFLVLVTDIEGDGGTTAATAVAQALQGNDGLRVETVAPSLGSADDMESPPAGLGKLVGRARALAASHGAAVVVTGQMSGPASVRLRFVPATVGADAASGTWTIGDMLDLPVPFPAGGAAFLTACVAASLMLASDEERRLRLALLRSALRDGEHLITGQDAPLSGLSKAAATVCYGAMLAEMGVRTHQPAMLDRAQQVLRGIVAKAGPGLPPVITAAARVHLATVAMGFGGQSPDAARLEEAARHLQAAADVITADHVPDDSAAIWLQYGRTLHRLSAMTGKTEHMKEAVQGYHLAASVWTKASNADRWAELQYGMASVLGQYGEFTGSVQALDRAVAIFKTVAEVWTREANPRRWAGLQNNIGACRFAQGKRSGDLPPLREAAECFAYALEVYQSLRMAKNVHVTQKNIARVERLIGAQEEKA